MSVKPSLGQAFPAHEKAHPSVFFLAVASSSSNHRRKQKLQIWGNPKSEKWRRRWWCVRTCSQLRHVRPADSSSVKLSQRDSLSLQYYSTEHAPRVPNSKLIIMVIIVLVKLMVMEGHWGLGLGLVQWVVEGSAHVPRTWTMLASLTRLSCTPWRKRLATIMINGINSWFWLLGFLLLLFLILGNEKINELCLFWFCFDGWIIWGLVGWVMF